MTVLVLIMLHIPVAQPHLLSVQLHHITDLALGSQLSEILALYILPLLSNWKCFEGSALEIFL